MPFINKKVILVDQHSVITHVKDTHSLPTTQKVPRLEKCLFTHSFPNISNFPFLTSFRNKSMWLETYLLAAVSTIFVYIKPPFYTKKLIKMESQWSWYPGVFPEIHTAPRGFELSVSFLDIQHVWSLMFKAKLDVHYFLRSY